MAAEAAPRYVAIITDGNGRWAKERGLPPVAGHQAGADVVKARLRDAVEFGIEELTVYSFSTENWSRPREEVDALMAMFADRIDRETPELDEEGVRMRFIGRREGVAAGLQQRMDWAEEKTGANDRITLFVAFNYGGRAEIVDAAARYEGGGEEGKIAIRNVRRDVMHDLRELKKEGEAGEDDERRAEAALQKQTDEATGEIDSLLKGKEEEILEV